MRYEVTGSQESRYTLVFLAWQGAENGLFVAKGQGLSGGGQALGRFFMLGTRIRRKKV